MDSDIDWDSDEGDMLASESMGEEEINWGEEDSLFAEDTVDWGDDEEDMSEIQTSPRPKPVPVRPDNTLSQDVQGAGQKLLDGLAFGFGDEIAATGRTLIDFAFEGGDIRKTFEMYLKDGRATEAQFVADNPILAASLEIGAGITTGVGLSRGVGVAATRMGNVAKGVGVGTAESAAYGFGEGEGMEDRLNDAMMYGAFGAVLGGAGGALMRGAKEVHKPKFRDKSTASSKATASSSNMTVARGEMKIGEGTRPNAIVRTGQQAGDLLSATAQRLRNWTDSNVGEEWGRRLVDTEAQVKREFGMMAQVLDSIGGAKTFIGTRASGLARTHTWFENTDIGQQAKKLLNDAGQTDARGIVDPEHVRLRKLYTARKLVRDNAPAEVSKTFDAMYDSLKSLQARDPGQKATKGYWPSGKREGAGDVTVTGNYGSPVEEFLKYAEDIIQANTLGRRFGVNPLKKQNKLSAEGLRRAVVQMERKGESKQAISSFIARNQNPQSNTDRMISLIRSESKLSEVKSANLGEALYANFTMANKSPPELLTNLRTFTSASLIATFSNTVLNMAEIPAAMYKNGIGNGLAVLPAAIRSALTTDADKLGKAGSSWVKSADLGVVGQFLGEVKSAAKSPFGKALESTAKGLFVATGGRSSTQLTQELAINSSLRKARGVAAKGGIPELRKLHQARGLSDAELTQLAADLKKGDYSSNAVRNYAFASLAEIQPVATSSMPKAYLNHPNGRVLYGLKSYMIQQMNNMYTDVLKNYIGAAKSGLNTAEGRAQFGTASANGAKFVLMVGAVNAAIDPGRKEILYGQDTGAFESKGSFAKEVSGQLASMASGGTYNPKARQYGGEKFNPIDAPAIGTLTDTINAMFKAADDKEPDAILRLIQNRMLFGRQADEINKIMTRGDRLLIQPKE